MFLVLSLCLIFDATRIFAATPQQFDIQELKARDFVTDYEKLAKELCQKQNTLAWAYSTNITDENLKALVSQRTESASWRKRKWQELIKFNWQGFKDDVLRRKFMFLSVVGTSALDEKDFREYANATATMNRMYSEYKVCSFKTNDCNLSLEPEINELFRNSRNPEELKHAWSQWFGGLGRKLKPLFIRYAELKNKGAKANKLANAVEQWLRPYGDASFRDDIATIWKEILPFYQQFHAYVRQRLFVRYGKDVVDEDGPIPAHLLGNPWGQDWSNILDITRPFPGKSSIDVTEEMVKQNYTVDKMFRLSDEFFTSLGLKPMTEKFWKYSMLEKPKDREVVCHASAWDFCSEGDVRIKMCTEVNMEDFITVHHEMGHIEYDLQYADQSIIFQEGANPGFHEAVGDTLALSVNTPEHLKAIGLLDKDVVIDEEVDINFLFNMASQKIAFLPFGYLLDRWRWEIFEDKIKPEQFNTRWWELRRELQGFSAPLPRVPEDFDAGPKYHIASDVEYLRYFVAHILQFQFHKALCIKAGKYDGTNGKLPLHRCDVYNSKEAGKLLSDMLRVGSSKPWRLTLKEMTGTDKLDSGPILEYFRPLINYLMKQNRGHKLGWD